MISACPHLRGYYFAYEGEIEGSTTGSIFTVAKVKHPFSILRGSHASNILGILSISNIADGASVIKVLVLIGSLLKSQIVMGMMCPVKMESDRPITLAVETFHNVQLNRGCIMVIPLPVSTRKLMSIKNVTSE